VLFLNTELSEPAAFLALRLCKHIHIIIDSLKTPFYINVLYVCVLSTQQLYAQSLLLPQVAILWVLDSFHLALCIHAVYTYTVTGFGDFAILMTIVWSLRVSVGTFIVSSY
jgi:hypothetical protein